MDCPYCAEKIKDEAVVCRHCKRDFSLYKPLIERVGFLEGQIARLEKSPSIEETTASRDVKTEFPVRVSLLRIAATVVLPAILSIVCILFAYFLIRPEDIGTVRMLLAVLALGVSVLCPFPFGLLAGFWWPGRHSFGYATVGLLCGVLGLGGLVGLDVVSSGMGALNAYDRATIVALIGLYVFGAATLYLSGGLLGDLLERLRFPERTKSRTGFFSKILARFSGLEGGTRDLLVSFVTALVTSGLGLLGTLATAIFAYLATTGGAQQ